MNSNLPRNLRIRAIEYARKVTGIDRPVKEHRVHIEAFETCFKVMVENGMVKEEFLNGEKENDKT